uniref:purine-nucleoside phosphorylase n=1 Tax=viral metagenome TaxID=1070528 RepID=A0A6C0LXI5_9ZZZZ
MTNSDIYPSDISNITCEIIRNKTNIIPMVGIVLGSGMGNIADSITNKVIFSYNDLPGFTKSTVSGHAGQLIIGLLNGIGICCMKGRVHLYEGGKVNKVLVPIYTMKLLGCKYFIVTASVGSLRKNVGPGSIVCIKDHINMMGCNPLIGSNDIRMGLRFPSMNEAYNKKLRNKIHEICKNKDIEIHDGIYLSTLGPSFETPAEIRAFKILGADVVGMSTVPEIIAANHCGLICCGLTIVVNLASGLTDKEITHEETLHYSGLASSNVCKIISNLVSELNID